MTSSTSTYRQLLALLGLMIGVGILGNLISEGLLYIGGYSTIKLLEQDQMTFSERNWFRLALIINHFSMFLGAALVFGWVYYRNRFLHFIRADQDSKSGIILFWGLTILCSYPIVGYLTQLNEMIPLPTWATSGQENAFKILGNVLQMDHIGEFMISLILVGLLPALGEEFIFRGIVQRTLVQSLSNPHIAILIASVLFGLTHMQMERIIPLTFLGMMLGYAYHFTQSMIVPVILHFLNNSLQVLSLYIIGAEGLESLQEAPDIPIFAVIVSILLTLSFFRIAMQRSTELNESRP
jgi:uncharacterized protein